MSTIGAIKTVGDWRKQIDVKMKDVLAATMETTGRSLAQITKQAIILMARSAAALTKRAPRNRKSEYDARFPGRTGEYLRTYPKSKGMVKFYRFSKPEFRDKAEWAKAKLIKNAGLAKRSWMFSLPDVFGGEKARKPMRGVGYLKKILTDKIGGFILVNRLNYLPKILPAGWLQTVEGKVKSQLLYKAEQKLLRQFGETALRQWGYTGPGLAKSTKPNMAKYIRAA